MAKTELQIIIDAQDQATAEFKKVSRELKEFSKNTDVSRKSTSGLTGGIGVLRGALGLLAGVGFANLTKTMLSNASAMEQNRVAFDTMLGDADQAKILLQNISDFARKTPFDLPQLVEGSKKLLAYNISAKQILPTLNSLGNIAAGVGREKMPQLILALGQVKSAGKLTGNELRQFTEAGVPLLAELAKQSGKSTAQIKKDMEKGIAPSFKDVNNALNSMSEEGGRFFNLMERQSNTLGGQVENLKDNFVRLGNSIMGVSETGDVIKGSLFDQIREGIFGANEAIDQNQKKIVNYGVAIISSFKSLGVTIANIVTIFARAITAPVVIAVAAVRDGIANMKAMMEGDFSMSIRTTGIAAGVVWDGIVGDLNDTADTWINTYDTVSATNKATIKQLGELKDKTEDTSGTPPVDDKTIKKMETFAKKIKKAKDALKDLRKEYKRNKKEMKAEFKEEKKVMKAELSTGIAQTLFDKETEVLSLQKELEENYAEQKEVSEKDIRSRSEHESQKTDLKKLENEKMALEKSLEVSKDFLKKHEIEYSSNAEALQKIREFEAADAIGKLKIQYEEERREAKSQFKKEMKDLRSRYKRRRKELKKHLKEVKKELDKFLSTSSAKKIASLGGVDLAGRATGGSVTSGKPYIVGERGKEVFVPDSNGRIEKSVGETKSTVFNFNFSNATITNKEELIEEIQRKSSRALELNNLGIQQ